MPSPLSHTYPVELFSVLCKLNTLYLAEEIFQCSPQDQVTKMRSLVITCIHLLRTLVVTIWGIMHTTMVTSWGTAYPVVTSWGTAYPLGWYCNP